MPVSDALRLDSLCGAPADPSLFWLQGVASIDEFLEKVPEFALFANWCQAFGWRDGFSLPLLGDEASIVRLPTQ